MITKETKNILEDIDREIEHSNPIKRNYQYKVFTSRSKGISYRNGVPYQRKRRNWKDIELVSYRDSGYHLWHRCAFDEWATETLPTWEPWTAQEYIQEQLRNNVINKF